MPLPPKAELQWWYQFYSATERGRDGYDKYRRDFSKLIWQLASSKWERWRLDLVEGESKYDDLEGASATICRRRRRRPSPKRLSMSVRAEQPRN
jgi:hypothetical protein